MINTIEDIFDLLSDSELVSSCMYMLAYIKNEDGKEIIGIKYPEGRRTTIDSVIDSYAKQNAERYELDDFYCKRCGRNILDMQFLKADRESRIALTTRMVRMLEFIICETEKESIALELLDDRETYVYDYVNELYPNSHDNIKTVDDLDTLNSNRKIAMEELDKLYNFSKYIKASNGVYCNLMQICYDYNIDAEKIIREVYDCYNQLNIIPIGDKFKTKDDDDVLNSIQKPNLSSIKKDELKECFLEQYTTEDKRGKESLFETLIRDIETIKSIHPNKQAKEAAILAYRMKQENYVLTVKRKTSLEKRNTELCRLTGNK